MENPSIQEGHILGRSPLTKSKTRSLSDGGGTPAKLSPSPHIIDGSRRTSKDDSNLKDLQQPVTPRRSVFGLSALQMPGRQFSPPPATASGAFAKPAPLSPQLDHSQIYASPTNILPRRSRGLDFSRAATSLHHSTLAGEGDSSPMVGGAPMNIPARRREFGGLEHSSSSLWSAMGNQEKMNCAHSLGSNAHIGSDTSSSSDDDDMDEDMDDNFVTTPMVSRTTSVIGQPPPGAPFGSPAMSSLMSFQQRQRHRKSMFKKKPRGPIGLGFHSGGSSISNSPPGQSAANARRESISWQANQLQISAVDAEGTKGSSEGDGLSSDGQPNVVRRTVTRRGNLLPKTKGFARIRAALMEEGAPADAECKREAEVVKQVRESDVDIEARRATVQIDTPTAVTASLTQESLHDIPEDDMMGGLVAGLSGSFKQHAMRNSKGIKFWDTFSETSSVGGARTTPPPPNSRPRGESSMSEDVPMDSPSHAPPAIPPWSLGRSRADSLRSEGNPWGSQTPPSAAEMTRRINNKRRRDDDFDPGSIKRRAVSPGLSVHNSPIVQSPMQRDVAPWGSRPGSNGGDKGSDSSSLSGTPGHASGTSGRVNAKGRVGFQGMVDTNDGIMRMSIE